jgi:hypothetical protein
VNDRSGDAHLVDRLHHLGAEIAWPEPGDELPAAVSSEIARRGIRPRLLDRRRVVLVAVAIIAVLAVAAATRLVIGAIEVTVVPSPAAIPEGSLPLGKPISLSEAQQSVPFRIVTPDVLDPPDAVFRGGEGVALAWRAGELPQIPGTGWGAVLLQLPSDGAQARKGVEAEDLREARVGGAGAVWITGAHVLTIAGEPSVGVRGNILLWERDGVTLRLESRLTFDEARTIAALI